MNKTLKTERSFIFKLTSFNVSRSQFSCGSKVDSNEFALTRKILLSTEKSTNITKVSLFTYKT